MCPPFQPWTYHECEHNYKTNANDDKEWYEIQYGVGVEPWTKMPRQLQPISVKQDIQNNTYMYS